MFYTVTAIRTIWAEGATSDAMESDAIVKMHLQLGMPAGIRYKAELEATAEEATFDNSIGNRDGTGDTMGVRQPGKHRAG